MSNLDKVFERNKVTKLGIDAMITNYLRLEHKNAALREQLKEAQNWGEPVAWCWMDEEIGFGLPPDAVSQEATLLYAKKEEGK